MGVGGARLGFDETPRLDVGFYLKLLLDDDDVLELEKDEDELYQGSPRLAYIYVLFLVLTLQ